MFWILACTPPDPPPTPDVRPGVLRVGPAAPTVGAYGIAATPDRVYVSNLHVPYITIADATTGAWIGAIDLAAAGLAAPTFPRLFITGGDLWLADDNNGDLFRFVAATGAFVERVVPEPRWSAVRADDDGLWLGLRDGAIVRIVDGAEVQRIETGLPATAIAREADHFALLDANGRRAALLGADGALVWQLGLPDEPMLNDVAVIDGRVYVTERVSGDVIALQDGALHARIHTGSDTFALARDGSGLLVTNRQGATLSVAYDGAPGLVTALDADLGVRWTLELDKTIHFLAWDGARWWTANEDALRLSAFADGVELVRGEPLGVTLDDLTEAGGLLYAGSHLTDELWEIDLSGAARSVAVSGWPFLAVPDGEHAYVPCQESGDIAVIADMVEVDRYDIAPTFHAACDDGICDAHAALGGGAMDGDTFAFTVPADASLRWLDGRRLVLRDTVEIGARVQHMDVRALAGGLLVWEPLDARLVRVEGGVEVASLQIDGVDGVEPVVLDGDRAWVQDRAYNSALVEVDALPEGGRVVAAGAGVVIARLEDALVSYQDGLEVGRVDLEALRSPPIRANTGELGELRYRVMGGELVVANPFRATTERRTLPGLDEAGEGELAVGRWE